MLQDHDGNKIFFVEDGIYLKLSSDNIPKRIFSIRDGTVWKYVKSKHIMKHLLSGPMIGFNYQALKYMPKPVKYIAVVANNTVRKVKIQDILERKEFLYFKKEGFEKQIFYPLELMEKIK